MAHPKALTVIGQNTQGGPGLVAENKKGAAKRLCVTTHNRFYVANYDMCRRPRARSQALNSIDFIPMAGDT